MLSVVKPCEAVVLAVLHDKCYRMVGCDHTLTALYQSAAPGAVRLPCADNRMTIPSSNASCSFQVRLFDGALYIALVLCMPCLPLKIVVMYVVDVT